MSKIQAAVFDVDGTLFDYHDKKIHDSTVKAVRRLKEDGTVIIIASGRSYPLLGREVCSYRFTFDQAKTVVEISKAYGCGLLLKYNDHSYLYNKSDEMFQVFNNIGLSRDAFIECPSMDHHREELPIGFTIRGCEEAKAILSGQKDQFRVELFHDVTECDVFSPYVNKMTGLKKAVPSPGAGLQAVHRLRRQPQRSGDDPLGGLRHRHGERPPGTQGLRGPGVRQLLGKTAIRGRRGAHPGGAQFPA